MSKASSPARATPRATARSTGVCGSAACRWSSTTVRRLSVEAPKVVVDDFATSYFLTEHLVRRGCRRIVHLGGPPHIPNAGERLRGYRYAVEKFGLAPDGGTVIAAGVTFGDGRAAADELLRRVPEADGIFAWTDTVAVGAMNRLMACGVRIPGRMAVAGYSGTVLSTIVNPQLTTVEQPLDRDGAPAPLPNCCWSGSPMRRRPIALSC